MLILILGPPGSGKGTIAQLLAKKIKYQHLDLGSLLRKKATPEMKKYMEQGKLIPNKEIIKFITKYVQGNRILDGFPRNITQAKQIPKPDYIFYLQVKKATIYKRLQNRARIEQRTDDKKEIIKKRLEEYQKKTAPLLKYYTYICINAEPSPQEILKSILSHLKK